MKKLIIAASCLVLLAAVPAFAYRDGDFQLWHTECQEFGVRKSVKIAFEEEFRYGDDVSDFYYHHYDAGFVCALNKHLDLGANYRQVFEKKKGEFEAEGRPYINGTVKFYILGFSLEDRNRLEYRHFGYQSDSWRYRNKFTIKLPWKFTKLEIRPYVADEIFIDFEKALNRNRFYAGLGFSITKNIKPEVYYLLQTSESSSKWTNANVLGLKLKLVF